MSKPIAYRISRYNTHICYKCPECGCEFGVNRSNVNFCRNCGQRIDWENVMPHASEGKAFEYCGGKEKEVLAWINIQNKAVPLLLCANCERELAPYMDLEYSEKLGGAFCSPGCATTTYYSKMGSHPMEWAELVRLGGAADDV